MVGKEFILNNGDKVKLIAFDYYSRPIFLYTINKNTYKIVLVGNKLYSMINDEPYYPLAEQLQLRDYNYDYINDRFVQKKVNYGKI